MNRRLRGRAGARLTADHQRRRHPDQFDYDVVLLPEGCRIGTLNEDFAFESMPGDIFQLGNTSYRIRRSRRAGCCVEDARGQPPNIPFWFGEAPGRSDELSAAVSRLREQVARASSDGEAGGCARWLEHELGLRRSRRSSSPGTSPPASSRSASCRRATRSSSSASSTRSGDTHLVIHSPFGSRINRAWGLALRKRFCRKFNFELQAAALEDSIVLSLGPDAQLPAGGGDRAYLKPTPCARCWCRRCWRRRCSRRAGAGSRPPRSRSAASATASASAAAVPAQRRRGPAGRRVPRPGRLRGEHRRPARDARSPAGRADAARLPARDHGRRRLPGAAEAHRAAGRGAVPRPHDAVAARPGHPQRAALRLPRRRRRGGPPHAVDPTDACSTRGRRRPRPARSRGDRAREPSLAGSAIPTSCTMRSWCTAS